uniref:THAP-type domain-containing protein n=1 Tax=Lygus hesperus TaxID=30085 RepID=A0A146L7C7_LYGHE
MSACYVTVLTTEIFVCFSFSSIIRTAQSLGLTATSFISVRGVPCFNDIFFHSLSLPRSTYFYLKEIKIVLSMPKFKKCIVRDCPPARSGDPRSFFKINQLRKNDPERYAAFLKFADDSTLFTEEPTANWKICERHFEPYFIIRHWRTSLLSNGALPSLNPPPSSDNSPIIISSVNHDGNNVEPEPEDSSNDNYEVASFETIYTPIWQQNVVEEPCHTPSYHSAFVPFIPKTDSERTPPTGNRFEPSVDPLVMSPSPKSEEVVVPLEVDSTRFMWKRIRASPEKDDLGFVKTSMPRHRLPKSAGFPSLGVHKKESDCSTQQLVLRGTGSKLVSNHLINVDDPLRTNQTSPNNLTQEDEAFSQPPSPHDSVTSPSFHDGALTTCEHSTVTSVHRRQVSRKFKKCGSRLKIASSFKLYHELVKLRQAYKVKTRKIVELRQKIQKLKKNRRKIIIKCRKSS